MSAETFPSPPSIDSSSLAVPVPAGAPSSDHWASHARVTGEKETFTSEAVAAEYLLVDVAAPRPTVRGRLAMLVEGAIERALDACGAPPPALTAGADFDGSLEDLLRRADVCGNRGIAIWVPSLVSVVAAGVLDTGRGAAITR